MKILKIQNKQNFENWTKEKNKSLNDLCYCFYYCSCHFMFKMSLNPNL